MADPRTVAASPAGLVLLSGGLDSVAALVWAGARYPELRAITFDYGQPNRNAEVPAAQGVARERGVEWTGLVLADAMRTGAGLMGDRFDDAPGVHHPAFVPGRNAVLLAIAASHAAAWFSGPFDLIVGACKDDQAGFPDCRKANLETLAIGLSVCIDRLVRIVAPWADSEKWEILYAIEPDAPAFELVARSWSCYRAGPDPCGACGACVKRAAAFAKRGRTDRSHAGKMHGGDSHREYRP